jgi:spermidine synthase
LLLLNDERSAHTIRDESAGWTGHYYDYFALGPLLVPARRLLVLGMGAGGSIASTRATAPDIEIDAVEIDQKVVEAGVRLFGLQPDQNRLRVHVADARPWLARDQGHYEIIHIDLYQGGPYVPFYLVTVQFFQMVRAHMSDDGLLMMNVFDVSDDRELLMSTAATLSCVFPTAMVLSVGSGNHLVFAFAGDRGADSIRSQLRKTEGGETFRRLAQEAATEMSDLVPPVGTPVFTDDHAPVEEITRRMLAKYRDRTL